MSLKRIVSLTPSDMPPQKRVAYASGSRSTGRRMSSGRVARVPRPLRPGAYGNKSIIPLTVDTDFLLVSDPALAFAFDTLNMYVNGGAGTPIPGAAEVAAVYGMMRVHKVEFTLIPAATSLDYNNQGVSSGVTNIPFIYEAVDYEDGATPTLLELRQNPTCRTHVYNKVIKRTVYPRLEGSNGIIDVGANRRNMFQKSGTASSQKWHGWKMYGDMINQVWTYGTGRVSCKIYYECMQSK